jgi:mono/diheme cytochrome c family protein
MKRLALCALAIGAALALPAAATDNADKWTPQAFYADRCERCHGASGWGTRTLARRVPAGQVELTRRTALPAAYIVYVVRHGAGSMPPFTPTELTDRQLAELSAWLARPQADGGGKHD